MYVLLLKFILNDWPNLEGGSQTIIEIIIYVLYLTDTMIDVTNYLLYMPLLSIMHVALNI